MFVRWTNITWNDWRIVEEVEDTAAMAGKNDLFLGTLNHSREFGSVCLLQLLTCLIPLLAQRSGAEGWLLYNVRQLCLSN